MQGWGERVIGSEDDRLRGVDMFIYTEPAGLLGRFIGRALRFHIPEFYYVFGGGERSTTTTTTGSVQRVEVPAECVQPQCEVHRGTSMERLPLTQSEKARIARRLRSIMLEAEKFPLIEFDIEAETPTAIDGTLHLHGESHPVQCRKEVQGTELLVQCPISLKQFHVKPYILWLGLFSVNDNVMVETRIPSTKLKL